MYQMKVLVKKQNLNARWQRRPIMTKQGSLQRSKPPFRADVVGSLLRPACCFS